MNMPNAAAPTLARVLQRLEQNAEHAAPLARLATLRALLHLYGHAIANSEERMAVATVFAQAVQQQQQLIVQLDAAGVRLDMRRANVLPDGAPPELLYRMAEHEILREEIELVQQAKAENALVSFALRSRKRLVAAMAAIVESMPDIATPEGSWIPSEKEARRPLAEVTGFMLMAATIDGRAEPVVVAFKVGDLQALSEKK